jgi:uncharacterized protein YdhG (YjbR/CyaY superfamily)
MAESGAMAATEIDSYLVTVEEPKRSTLQALRETIRELLPGAEECISYGSPAFRQEGKVVAGFAAFKNHLSYLPHSGWVFTQLADDLRGYTMSSGALRFPVDKPLLRALVKKLIDVRLKEIREGRTA